jgi:hypothetical protein
VEKSQFQEFQNQITLLTRLAAAQIQVSVTEADREVNALTEAFTDIVEQDRALRDLVKELPENTELQGIKKSISEQTTALGSNVQNAIVAFQFFDRMCQRLEHSIQCLKELSDLELADVDSKISAISSIRENIYQSYSMEEERILFDAVLKRENFEDAIKVYRDSREQAEDEDDIEFF